MQINSRDDLCEALGETHGSLEYFSRNVAKHVSVGTKPKKNGKAREYLAPSKELKLIQRRIKEQFFDGYSYPDYCYGLGVKTLREHAHVHAGRREMAQLDLRDFFPSISHTRVYEMWIREFGLPADIARLLTKLTTLKGRLPQGFPTSSHIAAIVARQFTDEIERYCRDQGVTFTLYVDDINFSATSLNKRDVFKTVISLAHKSGFSIKKAKTSVRSREVGKEVTGVSIVNNRIRPTREIRKRAILALKDLASNPADLRARRRVMGYWRYIRHLNGVDARHYARSINVILRSRPKR